MKSSRFSKPPLPTTFTCSHYYLNQLRNYIHLLSLLPESTKKWIRNQGVCELTNPQTKPIHSTWWVGWTRCSSLLPTESTTPACVRVLKAAATWLRSASHPSWTLPLLRSLLPHDEELADPVEAGTLQHDGRGASRSGESDEAVGLHVPGLS